MAFGQALLDAGYLEDLTVSNLGTGSSAQLNTINTFDEKIPYRYGMKASWANVRKLIKIINFRIAVSFFCR